MTYGYQVRDRSDRLFDACKRRNKLASKVLGNLLIDHIPLCMYALLLSHQRHDGLSTHYPPVRHIPEWLPWFSYKPLIRVGRELGKQVLYPPIQFVKESMVSSYLFR